MIQMSSSSLMSRARHSEATISVRTSCLIPSIRFQSTPKCFVYADKGISFKIEYVEEAIRITIELGELKPLQRLYQNRPQLQQAGREEIVKWLDENRTEGRPNSALAIVLQHHQLNVM